MASDCMTNQRAVEAGVYTAGILLYRKTACHAHWRRHTEANRCALKSACACSVQYTGSRQACWRCLLLARIRPTHGVPTFCIYTAIMALMLLPATLPPLSIECINSVNSINISQGHSSWVAGRQAGGLPDDSAAHVADRIVRPLRPRRGEHAPEAQRLIAGACHNGLAVWR